MASPLSKGQESPLGVGGPSVRPVSYKALHPACPYCPLVAQEGGTEASSGGASEIFPGGSDKLSYVWWRRWTNGDILGRLIGRRLLLVGRLFLIPSSSV